MKRKITKYDKTEVYKKEIAPIISDLKVACTFAGLPMFVTVAIKNDDKTGTEERTLSYYAGNWWGNIGTEKHLLTINTDSSITVKIGADDEKISSSSVTRVSDTSYIASYHDSTANKNAKLTFIFNMITHPCDILYYTFL